MTVVKQINESADFIKSKNIKIPKTAVILGSGLGYFADNLEDAIAIPYDEIPNFTKTTVAGHKGRMVFGKCDGVDVVAMQGRFHLYEGHGVTKVVLPVRVLARLGVENFILTNAAGGISPNLKPGDLAVLTDQINLTGENPLIGENIEEFGPRFPDMSNAFSEKINKLIFQAAEELNLPITSGIYCAVKGPCYETPAEIQMYKHGGADLVGMSTVPEVIALNHMGVEVSGISIVTNLAAGLSGNKLDHDEVKEVANMVTEKFSAILSKTINLLGT
jgi:purine-nucleoside phosphorylase